jgi:hypothetical protein
MIICCQRAAGLVGWSWRWEACTPGGLAQGPIWVSSARIMKWRTAGARVEGGGVLSGPHQHPGPPQAVGAPIGAWAAPLPCAVLARLADGLGEPIPVGFRAKSPPPLLISAIRPSPAIDRPADQLIGRADAQQHDRQVHDCVQYRADELPVGESGLAVLVMSRPASVAARGMKASQSSTTCPARVRPAAGRRCSCPIPGRPAR